VSSLGDAKSSLGDAESSLGDAKSSLGLAKRSLGLAKSSLGDAESSLGDDESSLGDAKSSLGDAKSSLGDAKSSLGDAESSLGDAESSLGGDYSLQGRAPAVERAQQRHRSGPGLVVADGQQQVADHCWDADDVEHSGGQRGREQSPPHIRIVELVALHGRLHRLWARAAEGRSLGHRKMVCRPGSAVKLLWPC
jgi:hypothetical protein